MENATTDADVAKDLLPLGMNLVAFLAFIPAGLVALIGVLMDMQYLCGFECNAIRLRAQPVFFSQAALIGVFALGRLVLRVNLSSILLGVVLIAIPFLGWFFLGSKGISLNHLMRDVFQWAVLIGYFGSAVFFGISMWVLVWLRNNREKKGTV